MELPRCRYRRTGDAADHFVCDSPVLRITGPIPAPVCAHCPAPDCAAESPLLWVSTADLARDSVRLAAQVPLDAVGVVGLPRSGLIPAAIIATLLHLPLYELSNDGVLTRLGHGSRGRAGLYQPPQGPLVVVDDTVYGGYAMRRAREAMARLNRRAVFAAVYTRLNALPKPVAVVDFFARELPSPHLLEWNLANNGPTAGRAANPIYGSGIAFDIDGVVIHDEHSGGRSGTPYLTPRLFPVPLLVTGRAERHRRATEAMLHRLGVRWQRLEMLPDGIPPTLERIADHKARHYKESNCGFFIESDPTQAELIHHASGGKPVICPSAGKVWPIAGPPESPPDSLLPLACMAPLFSPLIGKRIGLIHSPTTGNAGDRLIEQSAEQLLQRFGIEYEVREPDDAAGVDVLLLFGGGNFGHPYCAVEAQRRARALASGVPCVLLPQTAYGPEPGGYTAAFARDVVSLGFIPGSVLAPDLALCCTPKRPLPPATVAHGEFYTTAAEGLWKGRGPDIRHEFSDPWDYLEFIARHRSIVTDCLHVAICGLIARRRVTLLPTALHKQRSMYDTWLRNLGCHWADSPEEALAKWTQ